MKNFYERLLKIIVWLCEQIMPPDQCADAKPKVVFSQVRTGGEVITGEITAMKKEFGFDFELEAKPVGGTQIEAGSAAWSYAATDADGNDVSDSVTVTPNADNELRCRFVHDGSTVESTGVVTLRADGDSDLDEEFPAVGTLDIVVDSPNVTAFELAEVGAA